MENLTKKKKVSFSQYASWFKCPHRWWLDYSQNKRIYDDSINTCFGTAIHEALQLYVQTLYTEGSSKADSLDLYKIFKEAFEKELKEKKVEVTEDDQTEFTFDGQDILSSFCSSGNRLKHFPSNKYEFIGVEVEMRVPIRQNIDFVAYIDLVLKDKVTGHYKIIDFKTATNGWNQYQKEDESKYSQLLLYKALYSKQFNVPLSHISIEFFIVKRKLFENVAYPQSRIQNFVPTNNGPAVAKTLNGFAQFINECFTKEGDYKDDPSLYPKIPGNYKKNCKYCPHKKVNCDAKES